MAATWGEAEVEIHIDGDTLPAEVRAVTEEAAALGGKTFQKRFNKYMRASGRSGAKELAKGLGDLISSAVLSSGAVRKMYQATVLAKRGFLKLNETVKTFAKTTLTNLNSSIRRFGTTLKEASDRNLAPFREGFRQMIPTLEDWQATFPKTTKAIQGTTQAFRRFGLSVRQFGNEMKTDQIKIMRDLRDGFRAIKPSLDDLQKTFPGVTKAIRVSRTAFVNITDNVKRFGSSIKGLGPDLDVMRDAVERNSTVWTKFGNRIRNLRTLFGDAKNGLREYNDAQDDTARRSNIVADGFRSVVTGLRNIRKSTDDADRSNTRSVGGVRKLLSVWKRMPHGLRQAAFWIGLVAAAMTALAVLGSAATGGVLAVVTALGGLAAGVGLAVIGFKGLFAENAKLTAGAAATKKEFQDLGKVFKELQSTVVTKMFEDMAPAVDAFGKAILNLKGPLGDLSATVGDSISKVFEALGSDSGIGKISTLLAGFGPIFSNLIDGVIGFGSALGSILIEALPLATAFSEGIKNIGESFATWANSEEGRARLQEFFATAQTVLPLVGNLFVAAGEAIGKLVTPESIAQVSGFLVSLTNFMPVLGEILGAVGALNVFGIIAAALDTLGQAISPLLPALSTMASLISTTLITVLAALAPILTSVANAFLPFLDVVLNLATQLLPILLPPLMSLVTTAGILAVALLDALLPAFTGLVEPVMGIIEALIPLLPLIGNLAAMIVGALIPVVEALIPPFLQIIEAVTPIIEQLLPPLIVLFDAVMQVVVELTPIILALIQPFLKLIPVILPIITSILPPLISLFTTVVNIVSSLLIPILKILTPVIELLATILGGVLTVALGVVATAIDHVAQFFDGMLKAAKPVTDFLAGAMKGAIEGITKALGVVTGAIKTAIDWFGSLFGAADKAKSKGAAATSQGNKASGGFITAPRVLRVGESGPEAIVPLRRSLSRVNPQVRALSAIAQGMDPGGSSGGGFGGSGKTLNVAEGAIVIQGVRDPNAAALGVVNRLAERIAG